MSYQHKELAYGGWGKLSLVEQLANIGSEVTRALHWQATSPEIFEKSIDRALELLDLTLQDERWRNRLKEIVRLREVLCEAVFGKSLDLATLKELDRYFFSFAVVVSRRRT